MNIAKAKVPHERRLNINSDCTFCSGFPRIANRFYIGLFSLENLEYFAVKFQVRENMD